jgi:hypothetical protein
VTVLRNFPLLFYAKIIFADFFFYFLGGSSLLNNTCCSPITVLIPGSKMLSVKISAAAILTGAILAGGMKIRQ